MGKIMVFDHPLIQHKVSMMRDKNTTSKEFRDLAREVAMLMAFEVTRDLPTQEVDIETPICPTTVKMLKGLDVAIVPILRAGLGFVDGMLEIIPNAKVGHVGLYRDPDTHEPVENTYFMLLQKIACIAASDCSASYKSNSHNQWSSLMPLAAYSD